MTVPVPDAELVADLIRLARKGAYAVLQRPDAGEAGAYGVFSPRNDFAQPIATLPARSITRGLAGGWLIADSGTGRVELSEAGRRVLRRALSEAKRIRPPSAPAAAAAATADPPPPTRVRAAQRTEGPLAWLRRRKDRSGRPLITQPQFEAGERLAVDYAKARMQPRVTANWSPVAASQRAHEAGRGGVEISDAALSARERLHRALAAVGPEIAPLLLDVCCQEIGLEQAERARGWPQRSGKVVLDMGLTALARHYGLLAPERQTRPQRPLRWVEEGYAPTLDAWR